VIVGGEQSIGQALKLAQHPHIVICTPGRLVDHLRTNRGDLYLKRLKFLVLDEADRLLAPAFEEALALILTELPPSSARQTLYFSATMTATLDRLKQVLLRGGCAWR
jgi:ATP-dependent RNA helicase DDX49/DBP8